MFQELPISRLYLIDPYSWDNSRSRAAGCFGSKEDAERAQTESRKWLERFEDRITWVYCESSSVRDIFIPQNSLDFVYIDGNHSYEACLQDLKNFFPRVKSGGLVAGHDYGAAGTGVKKAVDEYIVKALGYEELFTQTDALGGRKDWWIIK